MPLLRHLPSKLGLENNNGKRVNQWIDSLMLKGVRNYEDLALCDSSLLELSRECRVPFEVLNSWSKWIKLNYSARPTSLFEETSRIESKQLFHSFGCERFDRFIGGIPSGVITQISGDEASGKTQLCHALAVQAAMKKHQVLYVDTESTLSGERLINIIKVAAPQTPVRELCDRIKVAKIFDVDQLFHILHNLNTSKSGDTKTNLLIIDSMLGILAPHVVKLSLMGEIHQQTLLIREFAKILKSLVINDPGLSIVVTNGNLRWFTKSSWHNVPNLKLNLSTEAVANEDKVVRKFDVRSYKCDRTFYFTIENEGCKDYNKVVTKN